MPLVPILESKVRDLLRSWAATEVVRPLVEPVLHPSKGRVRALGLSSTIGNPLFYLIWAKALPQPYEHLPVRILMSGLGAAMLLLASIMDTPPRKLHATLFTLIFWVNLPCFFWWMYFCNGGNTVWLASLGAMFLIYYHVTDWRLATLGSALGMVLGWVAYELFGPNVVPSSTEQVATNAVVIGFTWFMGLLLGISSSNLRREQLNYTLATMGIMAHELRTPLATMALIGEAVRNEAPIEDPQRHAVVNNLADRLLACVRNMNHQIDTQITNARLARLPTHQDTVSAAGLVREAVEAYPYRTARERDCVSLRIEQDFHFRGSHPLFLQVIDNLVKNALRSLAASKHSTEAGDLLIEVACARQRGRIAVRDRGVGMDPRLQTQIFEPFFSTNRSSGHGLGLAFCQRVVQSAHGAIRVESAPLRGAAFIIELPMIAPAAAPASVFHALDRS